MQYKLVQNKDLKKFNEEVNKLLKDNYELHGDYRTIIIESTEKTEGYVINSQLLQKDEEKPTLGFNVKKI